MSCIRIFLRITNIVNSVMIMAAIAEQLSADVSKLACTIE